MRLDRNEDRAIGVFVQIRAANSDETISDQDFAGWGFSDGLSMVSNRRSLAA
jgi:hypothetical protein